MDEIVSLSNHHGRRRGFMAGDSEGGSDFELGEQDFDGTWWMPGGIHF